MVKIWADRLIAYVRTGEGQQWTNVPASRKTAVKTELAARVKAGEATAAEYQTITGETYTEG
ncbi:MAG: XkdX family protein [Oscillospiraceae bacterium]|nr:XkdX family protein [Oscillospiraceae bacterium]